MRIIYLLLFLLAAATGYAQTAKPTINDLSFMAGTWTQDHEWGWMEEHWSKPMGNCMASSFRCVKDGKVVFYEFMVIEQDSSGPVLKLRHFNAGNIAWEDKNSPVEFVVLSIQKNSVVFESRDKTLKITYTVVPEKQMNIILDEKNKEGIWSATSFNLKYSKN
ncbi:DUF6265 family protein [Ferruginibacter sp. HRS2-29]|uniref:DUF6265 family protein n=1 Tax=Ferruginibacter sp. HRS2-29 TaxID=2487334 RepID=UPI0020CB99F3|nr:DUF6265 family protein [Ferruginibacter sp. HRS2-29]MCP9750674.1 hypothetical protein [Ferruginibacter sp. HRS2-29]